LSGSCALAALNSQKHEITVMRRNSFAVECAKVAGVSNNLRLTQRAPDGWESARFWAVSWLEVGSVKIAFSRPTHPRVTLPVGG
jgi:hypothetical protein